jgi:hypothetical protein
LLLPLDFIFFIHGQNLKWIKFCYWLLIVFPFMVRLIQAVSRPSYNVITNTTMMISNMVGPVEKITLGANTVKSFSFFVSGVPQVSNQAT